MATDTPRTDGPRPDTPGTDARERLRADCAHCAGLCCVALPFHRSSDFAFDKAPGTPCRHLDAEFRCGVHATLRERGMAGCTTFDCLGAGQHVVQDLFGGRTWREDPSVREAQFGAFATVRRLHELLWYVADALDRPQTHALRDRLRAAAADVERLTRRPADELVTVDPRTAATGRATDTLLHEASVLVRGAHPGAPAHAGADLVGRRFVRADLRGADLTGALLLGADLRGADLRLADLRYADLRGADLAGADLSSALYALGPQVAGARGDASTRLPAGLAHPAHWG